MSKSSGKSSQKTPQAIRGTQDIFGADAESFAFVVETFERVRKLYRFRRVEMPVFENCLLYTSPSPRDNKASRMPSSA